MAKKYKFIQCGYYDYNVTISKKYKIENLFCDEHSYKVLFNWKNKDNLFYFINSEKSYKLKNDKFFKNLEIDIQATFYSSYGLTAHDGAFFSAMIAIICTASWLLLLKTYTNWRH